VVLCPFLSHKGNWHKSGEEEKGGWGKKGKRRGGKMKIGESCAQFIFSITLHPPGKDRDDQSGEGGKKKRKRKRKGVRRKRRMAGPPPYKLHLVPLLWGVEPQ